ncbi:MAG: AIR synthase family protein [Oliverpabstia sp.]|nr:AIR synthase family protein [Lachnospiraceae bacterium]MDY5028002.1 AIR synthase family protein [Oliverpabstia sp.]
MKIGKLPEPVLIRSVLKQVKHRREEVLVGPAVGQDCAVVQVEPDEVLVMSTDPITGTVKDLGSHSIHITANDLAASGAEPIGVMLTVMLPDTVEEPEVKKMMQEAEATCKKLNMEVLGGHTEITNVVRQPLISVTGVGKIKKSRVITTLQVQPEQDIVVTKWIGLEATTILAKEREEELRKRFPAGIVDTAIGFDRFLSVVPESRIAMEHGVTAMHDITEGGVFGALWEMASGAGVGLEVDLKKIPIRQETVEICQYFDLNPYQIMSSGSMMIAADDGHELVRKLEKAGIHAAVVGRTNAGNDRILRNGEDVRYLDKPQPDELYKVLG